jgi:alpha-L-fucosidase 2
MIFGQLARERVQFNDITLWTGDDKVMGRTSLGDVYINLPGHEQGSTAYARQLDLTRSLHTVSYTHNGVKFRARRWPAIRRR